MIDVGVAQYNTLAVLHQSVPVRLELRRWLVSPWRWRLDSPGVT